MDWRTVTRGGLAIDLDVDIWGGGQLFGRDVGCAWNVAQHDSHLARQTFEFVQIAAENLDADLCADAVNAKTGMKAKMMIVIEKKIGWAI